MEALGRKAFVRVTSGNDDVEGVRNRNRERYHMAKPAALKTNRGQISIFAGPTRSNNICTCYTGPTNTVTH